MDFIQYIVKQREWSERTFGHSTRTNGITRHIEKELAEIRVAPRDLGEWIDVVILALDGAWRAGYTPEEIVAELERKQAVNFAREWPPAKDVDPDQPSEHVRADTPPEKRADNAATGKQYPEGSPCPICGKPVRAVHNNWFGRHYALECETHGVVGTIRHPLYPQPQSSRGLFARLRDRLCGMSKSDQGTST